MIITEVFYGVKCNRCGKIHDDSEHAFYSDEDNAVESAIDDEWGGLYGKHYCPDCHSRNEDEDDITPFPPFPNHVKLIRKLFSSMIRSTREIIIENEKGVITLQYSLINSEHLIPCDEAYIKDMLKADLIEMTQLCEKNHQTVISISIKI
jgi:hypothetical protein